MERMSLRAAGAAVGCGHSYLSKLVKEGRLSRGQDGLVGLDDVRSIMAQADPGQRRKAVVTGAGHQPVTTGRSPHRVTTPITTLPPADVAALWSALDYLVALVPWAVAEHGGSLQLAFDVHADLSLDLLAELKWRGFGLPGTVEGVAWNDLAEANGLAAFGAHALAADYARRRAED